MPVTAPPPLPDAPIVGLVGSAGAYGRWLRAFFEGRMGLRVLGHDPADAASDALAHVLDAADALEDRLRVARAEIEAVAGDVVEDPVGEALREMLRQRLWLRDHGADATPQQLAGVRQAIDDARSRIEHQLARIEEARAPRA